MILSFPGLFERIKIRNKVRENRMECSLFSLLGPIISRKLNLPRERIRNQRSWNLRREHQTCLAHISLNIKCKNHIFSMFSMKVCIADQRKRHKWLWYILIKEKFKNFIEHGCDFKIHPSFFLCCPYFLVQFIFIVDKMLGSGLKSSYDLYLVLSSPAQLLYIYHVIFTVLQAVACYNTNSGNKCGKLLIITILLKVQSGGTDILGSFWNAKADL